jgi:exodeoxyribonuclease V alpha subunit
VKQLNARARRKAQATAVPAEKIKGTVQRIKFGPAPDNGFTIMHISLDDTTFGFGNMELVTVKGNMTGIREGDEVEFEGSWHTDPKWGRQFNFTSYDIQMPTTKTGIVHYLTSTAYGVGHVKARAIYETLGEDCLDIIKNDGPCCLLQVKGMTLEMAEEVHKHLTANSVLAELSALICREGVTPNLAVKIYNAYGQDAVRVVKENPYLLSDKIHGVGFKIADRVAYSVGILPNNPYRVEAAIDFALKEAGNDGHCYLRPSNIVPAVINLTGKGSGVDVKDIAAANARLQASGRCIREGDCIYPLKMYQSEVSLAQRLRALLKQPKRNYDNLHNMIDNFASSVEIQYAPQQHDAVHMALTEPLSIITGGPGTGKSTVTAGIEEIYKEKNPNKPVYKIAPTGRAAKRIGGKTVHRELKYNPEFGGFYHNELNQLEAGLVIADEWSMADIELSDAFFKALPNDMQVVLVGDVDQLPSVGPGSVLRDCILSGVIPTTFLEFNYRQANGSKIAEFANLVKKGFLFPMEEQFGDWKNICVDNSTEPFELAAFMVEEEVKAALHDGYGVMDFQILAPMRRGSCGVNALNEAARLIVNPPSDTNKTKSQFNLKDKVMIVNRNDYNKMVFNGDIGLVVGEGEDVPAGCSEKCAGIYIDIEGSEVFFPYNDLDIVELAYAGTIHKAQGSEFPLVIMPLITQHWIMLQRNLAYTGWTRGRTNIKNIFQRKALRQAIENDVIAERFSRLKERLRGE